MKTVTLSIPDTLDIDNQEATMLTAAKFYEQGKVSLGQGAGLAAYSKRTLMELLGR